NVQHNCYMANCKSTSECLRIQEHVESNTTESFIVHKHLDRFIISSHVFHNTHLLRATLPRNLLAPIPSSKTGEQSMLNLLLHSAR
ncbi:hypothetical protein DFH08DRAFT_665836, partial [Mycena albidolilacea]